MVGLEAPAAFGAGFGAGWVMAWALCASAWF